MKKPTALERCSACDVPIAPDVAFHIRRTSATYCSACYLHRDQRGVPHEVGRRRSELLYVMDPQGPHRDAQGRTAPSVAPVLGTTDASVKQHGSARVAASDVTLSDTRTRGMAPLVPVGEKGASRRTTLPGPAGAPAFPGSSPVPASAQPRTTQFLARAPRAPLRCALASAHAACRLYEHDHRGDHRLRPAVALVAEVAAAGRASAPSRAKAGLSAAIGDVMSAFDVAESVTGSALHAVAEAAMAALTVVEERPWRVMDLHARRAHEYAARAVAQALDAPPHIARGVIEALAGQEERAFAQARALWPEHTANTAESLGRRRSRAV